MTADSWCREMLESSRAAQCPSVAYQLAGAKKVQQDLARPGVVERSVDGPHEASLIRACFAGAPTSCTTTDMSQQTRYSFIPTTLKIALRKVS